MGTSTLKFSESQSEILPLGMDILRVIKRVVVETNFPFPRSTRLVRQVGPDDIPLELHEFDHLTHEFHFFLGGRF